MITSKFTHALAAVLAICTLVTPGIVRGSGDDDLKAFPPAAPGMVRFVITLDHKSRDEEGDYRVEIITGKQMLTDGVNIYRLGNTIEPRTLQGWGYTYYEVTGTGQAISTMMAAPENSPKVEQFVAATPLLVRYNSRLPVVVYAPAGYEIRYRIWSAGESLLKAETR